MLRLTLVSAALALPCALAAQSTSGPSLALHGYLTQAYGVSHGGRAMGLTKDGTADYRRAAQGPRLLSDIRSSVAAGDATQVARAAHALKGAVGNFGPSETFQIALELEHMGRAGTIAAAAGRVAALEQQLGRLQHDLTLYVRKAS